MTLAIVLMGSAESIVSSGIPLTSIQMTPACTEVITTIDQIAIPRENLGQRCEIHSTNILMKITLLST